VQVDPENMVCGFGDNYDNIDWGNNMFSDAHLAAQNKEAVLREYTHAVQDLAERKALDIRAANTDLTAEFDRIDANAKPSI
jgi:hypothetical protein